jgi:ferredoxin
MVCNTPTDAVDGVPATYLGRTFHLCGDAHRTAFKDDPAAFFMHRMWGIPDWLYYMSIALVLVMSFVMFEGLSATPSIATAAGPSAARVKRFTDRIDLLQFGVVRRLLLSRPVRFVVQLVVVLAFLLIILAGLFGNQNPALNIAPLMTWTIWWCGLVVLVLFAGKTWCYMCPWEAIAFWIERLRFWKKTDTGTGLALAWPRALRNIWLATILFVILTWIELGFRITMQPRATACIAIGMLTLAIVSAFLFDRKSFCRYGCLVGRVSGLYALFSGVEIRHKSDQVCTSCRTKACVKGSDTAYGCPTFEYPGKMSLNTYCIQCTECLQACPSDNLAVNLRPWGADLAAESKPRSDEAYLALIMLSLSGFHGLTMTPVWGQLTEGLESRLPIGRVVAFSVGMAALMGAPIVIYAALVWLSRVIAVRTEPMTGSRVSFREYFIRYAYCVLPIALFYHLAHNLEHLLMEGPKVAALVSDPFGWGWNLLGTAEWRIPPLVSLDVLWVLQVILVGVGHVYSLWAARKISRRLFASPVAASHGQLPMLVGMILFSVLSLWLLKQPMEMRSSAM